MPEQCGDAALYFDPLDAKKIALAIGQIWVDDELALRMIKKGYEVAANNCQSNFNYKFLEIINREIFREYSINQAV